MAAFTNGNTPLSVADPELFDLIEKEKFRQWSGIELIASENFTSRAVLEANGSCLTNKYSEGLPNARYYGGNEIIDQVEILCQKRALAAFHLSPDEWGVNVQPYSGSTANFAAYCGILSPHDRIMGLDLPAGGHLTHGYYTAKKKVSATSIFFESFPYSLDKSTGLIDYEKLEETAKVYMPKLIIAGGSAYPRDWDYARLRRIATSVGAYLLMDMAHISGLVAAQEQNDPFQYCDIVTTTTHKSLRGPRAGLIFYRRGPVIDFTQTPPTKPDAAVVYEHEVRINQAVFPGCQGGPHNHCIAAVATCLQQAATPEFKLYVQQLKRNCAALGAALVSLGYTLVTGGTDNHLILWDLRPQKLTGSKAEKLFDAIHITANKNSVLGDTSAIAPGGIRLGSPAMTSRGLTEADFEKIASFLHRAVLIGLEIQETSGRLLKDFVSALDHNAKLKELAAEVKAFSCAFPMPGIDVPSMVYKE